MEETELEPPVDIQSHKVVVLGDVAVGKSSIVVRFVEDHFSPYRDSTIGAAFYTKTVNIEGTPVKLDLWDTAGQERYHSLAPMYYRGSHAIMIVYDITNEQSYQKAKMWFNELNSHYVHLDENHYPVIYLIGNKYDLEKNDRKITIERASAYAKKNNLFFMEVSAKSRHNIMELYHEIGHRLNHIYSHTKYGKKREIVDSIQLGYIDDDEEKVQSKKWLCCY